MCSSPCLSANRCIHFVIDWGLMGIYGFSKSGNTKDVGSSIADSSCSAFQSFKTETTEEMQEKIRPAMEILDKYKFEHTKGYTWTTDAFFRETPDKIEYFKNNGI